MDNVKKSLFERLIGNKKEQKPSCCCNIELEEIPEETQNGKSIDEPKEGDEN